MDRKDSQANHYKAQTFIQEAMEEYSLCEIWHDRNPGVKRYLWYRYNSITKTISASRIDFALISAGSADRVESVFYLHGLKSDHSAICLIYSTNANERGAGFWKLNVSLLQNQDFLTIMNSLLADKIAALQNNDPITGWEELKKEIKSCSVKFAKNLANERKLSIAQLTQKITDYEDNVDNLSLGELNILDRSKADLDELITVETKGIIFRSKALWMNEGERNTKYFYNLERSRAELKTCNSLFRTDGSGD